MPKTEKFRFIQITDLHFKKEANDPFYKENHQLRKWLKKRVRRAKPNLILFTGDLIDGKSYEHKKRINLDFLKEVKDFCNNLIALGAEGCEAVYTPGNHDIDHFDREVLGLHEQIYDPEDHQSVILKNFGHHDFTLCDYDRSPDINSHPIFQNYLNTHGVKYLSQYHKLENTPGVGVMNLNNSWYARKRGDDVNNLYLCHTHNRQILDDWEQHRPKLTLGIMHHPKHYLHISERVFEDNGTSGDDSNRSGLVLYKDLENKCDRILTGHTHRQIPQQSRKERTSVQYDKEFNNGPQHFNPINGVHEGHFHVFEVDLNQSDNSNDLWRPLQSRTKPFFGKKNMQERSQKVLDTLFSTDPNVIHRKPRGLSIQKLDFIYQPKILDSLKESLEQKLSELEKKNDPGSVELIKHTKSVQEIISKPYTLESVFEHFKKIADITSLEKLSKAEDTLSIHVNYSDFIQDKECFLHTTSEFSNFNLTQLGDISDPRTFRNINDAIKGLAGISGTPFFRNLYEALEKNGNPIFSATRIKNPIHINIYVLPRDVSSETLNAIADQAYLGHSKDPAAEKIINYIENEFVRYLNSRNIQLSISDF